MASASAPDAGYGEGVFGSILQLSSSLERLHRIAHLDATLSHNGNHRRQEALSSISQFWERISGLLGTGKEVQAEINAGITSLPRQWQLLYANRETLIQKYAPFFFSDKQSLVVHPVQQSKRGNKGPTLLVDYYWVSSPKTRYQTHESYVVKWTDRRELVGNHIYRAFASLFSPSYSPIWGFKVPQVSGLDMIQHEHEMPTGERVKFSSEMSEQLKIKSLEITRLYSSALPSTHYLMFSEKIQGENMFDFARNKYHSLTREMKERLFEHFSHLAYLDVFLLGNLDRFIQIDRDQKGNYDLQKFEANLGNLMIRWDESEHTEPELYAIDNNYNSELTNSPSYRANYLSLLTCLLSLDLATLLSKNLLDTCLTALNVQADDISDEKVADVRKSLLMIIQDLTDFGGQAFHRGFTKIHDYFRGSVLPLWETESAQPLKTYLKGAAPEMLSVLQERLDLLKDQRSLPS